MRTCLSTTRRRAFVRCTLGSISLEITIILPTLILLLIIVWGGFDVFKVYSQASKVGYAINDMVSRYDTLNNAIIDELYDTQERLYPSRMSNVKMRISSICFEDSTYQVLWSTVNQEPLTVEVDENGNPLPVPPDVQSAYDAQALPILTDATIPLAIMPTMADQTAIILTEISATYTPVFNIVDSQILQTELIVRSRVSPTGMVPHDDLNTTLVCPSVVPPSS